MTRPYRDYAAAIILIIAASASLNAADPQPRGSRILSVDITASQTNDYPAALALAKSCGAQDVGLSFDWQDLETTPGSYSGSAAPFFSGGLIDSFYPGNGMQVTLTLRPLHNIRSLVPPDLQATAMNDPAMIQRFENLLDWVFLAIPHVQLTSLVIGSEFDVNLGTDATKWTQYRAFYHAVAAYARTKRAGLKVAAEATWDGLTGFAQSDLLLLNQDSDYIGVSYYGIGANFSAKSMAQVSVDIDTVAALYAKPLCFYQFGYPSSAVLGGSESLQRDFITTAFASWDRHANILQMDFTWLHDLSPQAVQDAMTYFGGASARFGEFLGTLGYRTWTAAGTDKLSFPELRHQAKARGWANAIPVAIVQNASTPVGTAVAITLAGSDTDGDPLTFTIAAPPTHGALSGAGPSLLYTPDAGYTGPDAFTFTAADADAVSSPAAVAIAVAPSGAGSTTSAGSGTGSSSGGGTGADGGRSSSAGCGLGGGAGGMAAILIFALRLGRVRPTSGHSTMHR